MADATAGLWKKLATSRRMFLIAGPCVIESEALCLEVAEALAGISERTGVPVVFKSSFLKDNRSSEESFQGPGLEEGLRVLEKVRSATGLPVLSDVHDLSDVAAAADVLPHYDAMQIAGTGHFLMMEAPEAFNRALEDFLMRIGY